MTVSKALMKLKNYAVKSLYKFARICSNYRIQPQNLWYRMPPDCPEIYNEYGEKLNIFFLADEYYATRPYKINSSNRKTQRFIFWDRYNYGLKTHFYTLMEAFRTVGNPDRRFAVLNESRTIVPNVYKKFLKNKSYLENEFDLVFTYDEEILSILQNARLVPIDANYWYGENDSSVISPDNYMHKDKGISIIASNKAICPMHLLRQETARKCKALGIADTFGKFAGDGAYVPIELPFQHYMYSIVIENDLTKYYFTEKITNCFISQTIPIYLGASGIGEFFNLDGIITISPKDIDRLEDVLRKCTPEEYERRLPAILDNFERVKQFEDTTEYMYKRYLKDVYE